MKLQPSHITIISTHTHHGSLGLSLCLAVGSTSPRTIAAGAVVGTADRQVPGQSESTKAGLDESRVARAARRRFCLSRESREALFKYPRRSIAVTVTCCATSAVVKLRTLSVN